MTVLVSGALVEDKYRIRQHMYHTQGMVIKFYNWKNDANVCDTIQTANDTSRIPIQEA